MRVMISCAHCGRRVIPDVRGPEVNQGLLDCGRDENRDKNRIDQYYYHPDHLGSLSHRKSEASCAGWPG